MPLTPEEFLKTIVLFVVKLILWISDHLLLLPSTKATKNRKFLASVGIAWYEPPRRRHLDCIKYRCIVCFSPSGEPNRKTTSHKQKGPHNISVGTVEDPETVLDREFHCVVFGWFVFLFSFVFFLFPSFLVFLLLPLMRSPVAHWLQILFVAKDDPELMCLH